MRTRNGPKGSDASARRQRRAPLGGPKPPTAQDASEPPQSSVAIKKSFFRQWVFGTPRGAMGSWSERSATHHASYRNDASKRSDANQDHHASSTDP